MAILAVMQPTDAVVVRPVALLQVLGALTRVEKRQMWQAIPRDQCVRMYKRFPKEIKRPPNKNNT
eukprot:2732792-Pyramimonas_sp.AAC.1